MLTDLTERQDIAQRAKSDPRGAAEAARKLVAGDPADEAAASLLREVVAPAPAARSPAQHPPAVSEAAALIARGELERAEMLLREHLAAHHNDPPAVHLMAEIAARCGFHDEAARILRQSAQLHSGSAEALTDLARALHRIAVARNIPQYAGEALAALDQALKLDPEYEDALAYKALLLVQLRELDAAEAAYARLVEVHPTVAQHWIDYAFLLKTIGRYGHAVAAYRTAAALDPLSGAAWWGLANLKRAPFFAVDIERMEEALASTEISDEARIDLDFALAKAREDQGEFAAAAERLREGNALRARLHPYDPQRTTRDVDLVARVFTPDFLRERQGWGDPRSGPIFILGMPRSGSTLVEQVLASHSAIEGTEELPVLLQLAGELAHGQGGKQPEEVFALLNADGVAAFGARYLDRARALRGSDRPYFTDKHPSNWRFLGLVLAALPNARVIDIRRNPMDCCFANYAQQFLAGADFSYDQRTVARYYRDYLRLMRHFDEVSPGRVHRLIYDDLVDDLEGEVRRLLDYLELPFEEACLRFHETERAIHTPSSEQVRQPINRDGLGRWKSFDPWLGEMKQELGPALEEWRR
jgi:tetratricopeptide (TPR) repeat protein